MNINIALSINEVNAILGVLGKLPYEQVVKVIDKIRAQVTEQTAAAPPPAPPPESPPSAPPESPSA